MSNLFIWFPIILIVLLGVTGLILSLIDAGDKVEKILNETTEPTTSNVVDFPTRGPDGGGAA